MLPSRRSPYGERGLKLSYLLGNGVTFGSLPLRGAWIEILVSYTADVTLESLPLRGAWIEIVTKTTSFIMDAVAPPTGSVD